MKDTVKKAFLTSLPVMAGYIVLGIGFGILLQKNGYGPVWAFFMSLFVYAGTLQYAGVSLIASSASLITTFIMSLIINARHLFYGVSMLKKYKGAGKYKPYLIFSLTDETYALLAQSEESHLFLFLVSLMNQSYWIIGSVLGSLMSTYFSFNSAGVEFSMTALFLSVLVEQTLTTKNHLPSIIGLCTTLLCLLLFGSSNFLIPSMFIIIVLLLLMRGRIQHD